MQTIKWENLFIALKGCWLNIACQKNTVLPLGTVGSWSPCSWRMDTCPLVGFGGGCSRFLQSEGWSRTSSVPHILCRSLQNLDFYFLTCWMRIWAWDAFQTVRTALKFAKCTIPVPHSKHWVKDDLRAFQMLSPLPTAWVWRRYFSQGLRCCCWVSDQQGHTALVLSYLVES